MIEEPKLSLCQLSLLDTTFEEDAEIASAVGAKGLGVIESKLANPTVDHASILDSAGLSASICAAEVLSILPSPGVEWWFPGPSDVESRVNRIAEGIERLAPLEPHTVFCLTGPVGNYSDTKARAIVIDALRWLGSVAKTNGTRLAVEPMREQLRSEWTIVSNLAECNELLDEVGLDYVGIVLDVWHLWDSPRVHEMIPSTVDRIFGVQVSDYRSPNRGPRDRVVAGDGIADVRGLVRALRGAGYRGWYDMELFSDDGRFGKAYEDSLWKLEPLEFASRQIEGFLRCYYSAEN